MKAIVLSLLASRKFWLTVLSVASAVGAYWRHGIDADALAKIISGSIAVLVLAIAHEDNGANQAPAQPVTAELLDTRIHPDDTQPVKVPSIPAGTSVLR